MKNKKGVVMFGILIFVVLIMVIFYSLLFLPIPAFKTIRITINYFLMVLAWILIQIFVIYGYYKIGFYVVKGFNFLKYKTTEWALGMGSWIMTK